LEGHGLKSFSSLSHFILSSSCEIELQDTIVETPAHFDKVFFPLDQAGKNACKDD
jgi:hypothetical protein